MSVPVTEPTEDGETPNFCQRFAFASRKELQCGAALLPRSLKDSHEPAQARRAQEWSLRQDGQESEASHRYWIVRSPEKGQESPQEARISLVRGNC